MMNATVASPGHDPPGDLYDPDEVLPKNSPLLAAHRPRLSLSPPPALPRPRVISPPARSAGKRPNRMSAQPSQGDMVLLGYLDGWRRPEIAAQGGREALPFASDSEDDLLSEHSDSSSDDGIPQGDPPVWDVQDTGGQDAGSKHEDGQSPGMSPDSPKAADLGASALQSLAAGALGLAFTAPELRSVAINAGPTPPTTEHDAMLEKQMGPIPTAIRTKRESAFQDDKSIIPPAAPSPFTPHSIYSPPERRQGQCLAPPKLSPTHILAGSAHGEGLPPIQMNSPSSDAGGKTSLPSIRLQFGDLQILARNHHVEKEDERRRAVLKRSLRYASGQSPQGSLGRLPSISAYHGSPPVSPAEPFRRDLSSPGHLAAPETSPGYYNSTSNGLQGPQMYTALSISEATSPELVTSTSVMSVDSSNHHPLGPPIYRCKYPGCTATGFQTQYLLNSHANVHSSDRPHYCPVQGCPRSQGGKGFKRKNEMIRHGLVHASPGYVCPFCPEREHRYPRPDNLQRHVRAHHPDRDKDDPALRDVLAQRPDGPSRGRRRRTGPG